MSQDNTKGDEVTDTPPTYKEQLDEAAIKVKDPQSGANEGGVIGQVVEKGTDHKDESSREETKVPGPPERPHHDTQIEEFIKDQHRSKTDDGKLS
ncbi:hypothetical protein SLS63_008387 [Diaporthe eres]|uniref:Uncharacterized protein n=1 Tax=Diaporthe eres TaxID=83184 RepID=A0ABR1P357_DIAER